MSTVCVTCRSAASEHRKYASSRDIAFSVTRKSTISLTASLDASSQIFAQSHRDVVRQRSARGQPSRFPFEGRSGTFPSTTSRAPSCDFAVALQPVTIANREQGAGDIDGKIENRSGNEILVVEIAAVRSGCRARYASLQDRWRDPDRPEEWSQAQRDPRSELRGAGSLVDPNEFETVYGKSSGSVPPGRNAVTPRDEEIRCF